MDESWRMRMGMHTTKTEGKHNPPRRRSTDDTPYRETSENPFLDPEDFNDVFGGPPQTVMSRQFSGGGENLRRSSTTSFYEEIFRPSENLGPAAVATNGGRSLPAFRIPGEKGARKSNRFEGFYCDIFGWNEEEVKRSRSRMRSRSKSKTSSSSVLSSEDLSPLRPAIGGGELGDQDVSLFASKLRPINVPRRWTSNMPEEHPVPGMQVFSSNHPAYNVGYDYNENFRGSHFGFCQRNPSPETISIGENSHRSGKVSADDLELNNSPSSIVSSLCEAQEGIAVARRTQNVIFQEQNTEQYEDEDEDEVMSSYVIEINTDTREETDEAVGVDEAIAWAKEKFQTYCSPDMLGADQISDGHKDGNASAYGVGDEGTDTWISEDQKQQSETEMEMELLNEKIRLWSTGKEADIRLLLSTLHHILWSESGWLAVPLTNLVESSQVKKAYQKARLFLHPDKLQQRGATFSQKYVAEKAFPILQDSWAAFVSQDVICS